jgi:hypothetical protein
MKVIKRIVLIILILVAAGLIFRGWLYRQLITYKSIGQRTVYLPTNNDLFAYLNTSVDDNNNLTIEEIIKLALSITSQTLSFTAEKNETNPNSLISSKTAHCVGYASFFATTCNYLLSKYGLASSWTANPHAGQLYFLGVNVQGISIHPSSRIMILRLSKIKRLVKYSLLIPL